MEDLRLKLTRKACEYKGLFRKIIRNQAKSEKPIQRESRKRENIFIKLKSNENYEKREISFHKQNKCSIPDRNNATNVDNLQMPRRNVQLIKSDLTGHVNDIFSECIPNSKLNFNSSTHDPNLPKQFPIINQPHKNIKFISTNEKENADINDPNWKKIKNLKDIEEFKKYANSVFDFQNSNPNICETYHGYKRKQLRSFYNRQKRFKSPSEKSSGNDEQYNPECRKRKAVIDGPVSQGPFMKRPKVVDFGSYVENIRKALAEQKLNKTTIWHGSYCKSKSGLAPGEALAKRNWRFTLRHLQKSMEETKSILSSMCCDELHVKKVDSELFLSYEELKKVVDSERLFGQFVKFYGPNEEVRCRFCTHLDGYDVRHPY